MFCKLILYANKECNIKIEIFICSSTHFSVMTGLPTECLRKKNRFVDRDNRKLCDVVYLGSDIKYG